MGIGSSFSKAVSRATNKVSGALSSAEQKARDLEGDARSWDIYGYGANIAGSQANLLTLGLYDTARTYTTGDGLSYDKGQLGKDALNTTAFAPGNVWAHDKLILQPKRDAEAQAAKDAADADAAAAAAIAGLPKDPNVAEVAAQRKQRDGRRGTILTTPGQSLGSIGGASASGKSLLGL